MTNTSYIKIETICKHYEVEEHLIFEFSDAGILSVHKYEACDCIVVEDMVHFEKIIRLHKDLALNASAIDVVLNLTEKIDAQQIEIRELKQTLAQIMSRQASELL